MKNKLKMILLALFFVICITSIGFASENQDDLSSEKYEVSEETAENYIDSQLDKININELQEYIKDDDVFKNIDLKVFVKDLIKGDAKISDLINVENLKSSILAQLSTSLKVIIMIIVLALLSSILKSLENSFSSGDVAKIVNYII
ncbi:MAG: stage III sporulation protein AE, partial [Intestinibacter sp.]|uniref:stage III sporulation protein AE n=1 Tax=Intestinibacter sp. TaxID=1965304 RepID=UPI002F3FD317|nr:stage III sporulation protein AE [Intestinibacter sp.]